MSGPHLRITDTFDAFERYWASARQTSLPAQIESWARDYIGHWPELLDKQIASYADDGFDWRQVAAEHVFPHLDSRLPAMRRARGVLLHELEPVWTLATERLSLAWPAAGVLYVGIGCGAGWASAFDGLPAVLFGLENVAECAWTSPKALRGLFAHELGHLVHDAWRAEATLQTGTGAWWQLYREGLAHRLERVVLGEETWYEAIGLNPPGWLAWCEQNTAQLAAAFLEYQDSPQRLRTLFGSWFDFRGRKQCGYYLGHAVIRELENRMTLREIATLESPRTALEPVVEVLSRGRRRP